MKGIIFLSAIVIAAFPQLGAGQPAFAEQMAAGGPVLKRVLPDALAQAPEKTAEKKDGNASKASPGETQPKSTEKDAAPAGGAPAPATSINYGLQEFDDPLTPLSPKTPRTVEQQRRVDALAHYAAGRILESRNDVQGALTAYKKAIECDPNALIVYRALIPLASSLNLTDDAVKWSLKAVELDPSDYGLLHRLAAHQAEQGDFAGATKLLEQAVKAPHLKQDSALFVVLTHELAKLYNRTRRSADAADKFETVFDALQHPNKYHLDFRTRALLLADPAATFEAMGQVFLEAKRSELAIQAFQKAAESKKGNTGNLSFNLAQVFAQSDQPEKALEELQKYFDAQRQSKGRAAYELLVEILKKMDKSDELIPRLESLCEKDERNSTLQYFLADQYLERNRLDDAEKLYKKTLTTSAELQGYVGLASVYRQQNRPDDLVDALARGFQETGDLEGLEDTFKAIATDEKLVGQTLEVGRKLAGEEPSRLDFARAYVLASVAAEAKNTDAVQEFFRLALPLAKGGAALATVYDDWGKYLIDARKFAEAAKVFEDGTHEPSLADKKPSFLYLLSQAFELAGNSKGALDAIAEARQLLPDNPALQFQEALVFYRSHQYEEALSRFEKLASTPQPPQFKEIVRRALFSISSIHVLQGNLRKGEEILEGVLRESPDDPSVNNDLGYLYADQGKDLEKAEKMIRKAIAAEPENGAYLDSMGWVLFKQGKFADALPYLEKAVKNSTGGDETVWDHLGDAYQQLQQPAKALEAWKKALETAKMSTRPDTKLIARLEEKIKTSEAGAGKIKPERTNSP